MRILKHFLRSYGIAKPVMVKRNRHGLQFANPELVEASGQSQKVCTIPDCDKSIRWLVKSSSGSVCIVNYPKIE